MMITSADLGPSVAYTVVMTRPLEAFAGGEPRGADAAFPAVGFSGGDLAL
jgi:hypothetical protein